MVQALVLLPNVPTPNRFCLPILLKKVRTALAGPQKYALFIQIATTIILAHHLEKTKGGPI